MGALSPHFFMFIDFIGRLLNFSTAAKSPWQKDFRYDTAVLYLQIQQFSINVKPGIIGLK